MTGVFPATSVLLVVLVAYVPLQLGVWVWVLRDCWRERWNGKFRESEDLATEELAPYQYAASDVEAFVQTLYDETVTNIDWHMTVLAPLFAAGIVAMVWIVLTTIVAYLLGLIP